MSKVEVAVIDYGIGNLLSVSRGLEYCGAKVYVTSRHEEILKADRVVLPGVGAFADGMDELKRRGLDDVVCSVAESGTPLLGICLGMQMLLEESDEFGLTQGLGLIPGRVIPIPKVATNGKSHKVPHIGWNELHITPGRNSWAKTLMEAVSPGDAVYFVHSYMADPTDVTHRLADCEYGGVKVAATIGRDNVTGCQFHPEKSGEVGLGILKNFIN